MFGMKGLKTNLGVVRHGKPKWYQLQKYKLTQDLVYACKAGVLIIVPAGFITNFATWVKPRGKYDVASVIHDYLYASRAGRKFADKVFKECMERGGCSRARIHMMYYGVRMFGWWSYYIAPMLKRK